MKYCADTWFIIELSKSEPKALKIIKNLRKHKNKIIMPSVVILELTRISIKSGKKKILDELLKNLELNKNIEIVDCSLEISKRAGEKMNDIGMVRRDHRSQYFYPPHEKIVKILVDFKVTYLRARNIPLWKNGWFGE